MHIWPTSNGFIPLRPTRARGPVVAIAALSAVALVAGCSSSSGGYSIDMPKSDQPPNVVAGSPLPSDSVNKAVDKLDDLVDQEMKKTGVPGVAVAVVHGGKVIYAKGFGVRDVEHPDQKVDPNTVFQVASVSKSLSATVVASEVTKGDVSWDTPIADLMPGYALADPWVSSHVTVGDGMSHRTGLPGAAGDKLEDLGFDQKYIFDHLRMHKLNPFRVSYAYANYGFTSGAQAVAVHAGKSFADLAADNIYKPLGMASTSFRYSDFLSRTDRATLHQEIDGKWVHGLVRDPDQQDPAGGASSSINDMAKWLQLVLAGGKYNGQQIYSPEAFQPAVTPQAVSAKPDQLDARAGFYGYGFNVSPGLTGRTGFNHSGAFASGGATNVSIIPSADVGIVTLTNGWPIGIPETINDSFTDLVQYGSIKIDYADLLPKALGPFTAPVGELVGKTAPADAAPAKPLAQYAGSYANGYYGPATITEKDGGLVLGLGVGKTFPLKHWDGDTFTFTLDTENAPPGSVSQATFDGNKLTLAYYDDEGLGVFTR
ncbi:serine hydrolase [Jongsikchunia kroppenstedtii]|uniref:serine hydrolase n=1 Tax=Jongsikchunia kroppenstedtii TaxID=1121721 RepID=UPI000381B560|nr:serine hydrolase [Jongsikchunia kroppenstedtii]